MKQSERKFYRKVFSVEVLSEEPMHDLYGLSYIERAITTGGCSGHTSEGVQETLTGLQAANHLRDQGSSPAFFRLNNKGEDLDDEV